MVDEKVPESIYVPYDEKGNMFCSRNRFQSDGEMYEIFNKLEVNYEFVKEYHRNIFKWKRKGDR